MADAKATGPNSCMKNLHVARYKPGYLICLLIHSEGVDKSLGALYHRFEFEVTDKELAVYVKISADNAVFIKTLGSMIEDVPTLEKDCKAVCAAIVHEERDLEEWVRDMARFLRSSTKPEYQCIAAGAN